MNTNSIEREIAIAAPIDRVWSLVTEAEHLGTWFGDAGADVDLRPGGAIEIRWNEHAAIKGTVDAVEPTSRVAFRWPQLGTAVGVDLIDGNSTLVEFSLTSEGDGTRVRMVESGFDSLVMSDDDRIGLYNDHSEGWTYELNELKAHAAGVAA